MVEDGAKQLPDGWEWSILNDVADINYRDPQLRNLPDDLPVNFVPMAAVDAQLGTIATPEVRPLKEVRKGFTPFSDGDVIIAKITPSMENGKAAIARNLLNRRAFGSTEFHVLKPKSNVLAEYLFYFIRQESFRKDAKAHFAGTAGQLRVPASFLFDYPFPLAPLPEQERIVNRIEELLSDLEAGAAALERVRVGLKRYKASVLKAAVEGKLLENREVESSKELPDGWRSAKVEELADGSKYAMKAGPFGSSLKKEYYVSSGYKIYGQEQVIRGDPHYGDYYIDEERYQQLKSNVVKPGDILISLVGTIGKVLILPENIEQGIINPRLVKLSLDKNLIDSKYFKIYMETEIARHYFSTVSHGETMQILNLGILKKLPIPIPPLEEQRRIVAEVERRLSVVGEVESAVDVGLVRAGRLRQAVLRSAFEGKLL